MAAGERKRTVVVALLANLVIAAAKFVVAAISGSSALLSEAIHSTVDTGNELVLLIGQKRAARPPDPRHPFGHGLELYFSTLIVALLLFGIGGGMSIYEGVHNLLHPPAERVSSVWSYVVIGIAFVSEAASWSVALRHLRSLRKGRSLGRTIREVRDPQVVAVFFEDSAALVGLVFAAAGVTLTHVTGRPVYDSVAAILIGLTLCSVATVLAAISRELMLGEAAHKETVERMWAALRRDPDVGQVARPLTMHFGPEEILVNLEVQFRPGLSGREMVQAIQRLEADVRKVEPRATRVFVEAQGLQH